MLKLLSFGASLCVFSFAAEAQLVSNPNPPVPAAQAVGGAYTAAASGAEAPFWNPAGLAYSKGTQGRFAYQNIWGLSFLSHMSAAGSTQLPGKAGGIAIVFQTLGTRDGGYTLAAENEISVSHGLLLQEDIHSSLAFGYTAKIIGYNLGESVSGTSGSEELGSAATLGLDVGATAQLWDRFRLAGSMKNINNPELGTGLKRQLPRIFSGGLAYTPYYGVRTTFDLERILSGEAQFKGGIQAAVAKPFDLRFGIITNPNSFTGGFGLHWRELVVDYAFIYHPVLAPSHLIGIGFDLDKSVFELWRGE
ncbi:hypothetical protein HZB60_07315 [candidate division KSB1 bacterium]|nr:hypothetical protein [candidate division KSB1 bacterium]